MHRYRWLVIEKTSKLVVKYSAWSPNNYPSFSEFLMSIADKSSFKFQIEVLMPNGVQQIIAEYELENIEKVGYLYLMSSSGVCKFGGLVVFTDNEQVTFTEQGEVLHEPRKD